MNASMNDRKKAVLLAAVLLVIAILCGIRIYAVSHSSTGNGQALYADIYQSGELLETIRLDTVTNIPLKFRERVAPRTPSASVRAASL